LSQPKPYLSDTALLEQLMVLTWRNSLWFRFDTVSLQPVDDEDAQQYTADIHCVCPTVHEPSNHSPTEQDMGARACTTAFSTIWDSVWQWWL